MSCCECRRSSNHHIFAKAPAYNLKSDTMAGYRATAGDGESREPKQTECIGGKQDIIVVSYVLAAHFSGQRPVKMKRWRSNGWRQDQIVAFQEQSDALPI